MTHSSRVLLILLVNLLTAVTLSVSRGADLNEITAGTTPVAPPGENVPPPPIPPENIETCQWKLSLPFYKYGDSSKMELMKNYVEFINTNSTDSANKRIRAEIVPGADTVRLFAESGRINPKALVTLLLNHGNGTDVSNAEAMRNYIRYFSDDFPPGSYKSKSLTKKIRRDENFVLASAEAFHLPSTKWGADETQLNTPEKLGAYLWTKARIRKAETPDVPLIVYTRSSSAAFWLEGVEKNPGVVDGFIFMSPTAPVADWLEDGNRVVRELAAQGEFVISERSLNWVDLMLKQMHWDANSVGNIPTLIITGSADEQMSPDERALYISFAHKRPDIIKYVDIPNAGHDILREIKPKYNAEGKLVTAAYTEDDVLKTSMILNEFIHDVVYGKHKPN